MDYSSTWSKYFCTVGGKRGKVYLSSSVDVIDKFGQLTSARYKGLLGRLLRQMVACPARRGRVSNLAAVELMHYKSYDVFVNESLDCNFVAIISLPAPTFAGNLRVHNGGLTRLAPRLVSTVLHRFTPPIQHFISRYISRNDFLEKNPDDNKFWMFFLGIAIHGVS